VFELALPLVVAITGWWFFTGLILWLVHRGQRMRRMAVALWTGVLPLGLVGVYITAQSMSAGTTVSAFTLALLLWGWLELTYLTGWITGPRQTPCPPLAGLRERLRRGLATCLYHELAALFLLLALVLLCANQANPTALWAFGTLLMMRWSAKLNLVLGVRNYNSDWLPSHFDYLDSYIPRRAMNGLFPISLGLGTWATVYGFQLAASAQSSSSVIALLLVSTLMALGTLEHIFLMLPLHDAALWRWALPNLRPAGRTVLPDINPKMVPQYADSTWQKGADP